MAAARIKRSDARVARRLAVVRLAIVLLVACGAMLLAGDAQGAERPSGTVGGKAPPGAPAQRPMAAGLTVGDRYTVQVTCGGVVQSYEGKLLKVCDHWIVLRDYSLAMSPPLTARFRTVPVIGSWIRRSFEKPMEVDRWIPREAVTIVSSRHAIKPVTLDYALGNEPALHSGDRIEMARDGKVVSPAGDLLAIDGDNLTLKIDDGGGDRRELIARRDVFSISRFARCTNPDEAE